MFSDSHDYWASEGHVNNHHGDLLFLWSSDENQNEDVNINSHQKQNIEPPKEFFTVL